MSALCYSRPLPYRDDLFSFPAAFGFLSTTSFCSNQMPENFFHFNETSLVLSLDFCFAVKNPVKLCLVPILMPSYFFLNILLFASISMPLLKLLNYSNIMSVITRYICVKPSFAISCLIFLRYWILLVTPTPFTCLVLNSRTTSNLFVLALLRSLFLKLTAGVFSVPKKKKSF